MAPTPTRERLVTEAMRLFGAQGYQGTSVAQIEEAAGLAPGSGALYHHFKSKEELLEAGIDRQLDRRSAMRDIRSLFAGLGDLRIELTMLGRYMLTVLDDETQMLNVASQVPADLSKRLTTAYAALFEGLYAELADWVRGWAPGISKRDANTIAAAGVNALYGKRAAGTFLKRSKSDLPDEQYIAEWTAMIACRIETLRDAE
jgi:AcrR family transcriptional regulator